MRQINIKFSNKAFYTVIALLILATGFFIVNAAVDKNDAWHSASQVEVNANGLKTLQEAIDDGSFGGSVPSGAVMAFDLDTCPAGWTELATAKGKVIVGLDTGDSDFDLRGEIGGEKTHILTIAEMPSHRHGTTLDYVGEIIGGSHARTMIEQYDSSNNVVTNYEGGNQPHNILQPYITLLYCKKN